MGVIATFFKFPNERKMGYVRRHWRLLNFMILDALGVQILVGFMLQMPSTVTINKNTMLHVAMGYEIVLILKKCYEWVNQRTSSKCH